MYFLQTLCTFSKKRLPKIYSIQFVVNMFKTILYGCSPTNLTLKIIKDKNRNVLVFNKARFKVGQNLIVSKMIDIYNKIDLNYRNLLLMFCKVKCKNLLMHIFFVSSANFRCCHLPYGVHKPTVTWY